MVFYYSLCLQFSTALRFLTIFYILNCGLDFPLVCTAYRHLGKYSLWNCSILNPILATALIGEAVTDFTFTPIYKT